MEEASLNIAEDITKAKERWPQLIASHRYAHIWWNRGRKTLAFDDKGTELPIPQVHAKIVDALRELYFPLMPEEGNELDELSAKYEKTEPPIGEELKEWNKKRRELFEKGILKPRKLSKSDLSASIDEIRKLSDRDLILKHEGLHIVYNLLREGKKVLDWTPEEVEKCHALTIREMARRGIDHITKDWLDQVHIEYPAPLKEWPSLREITPDYLEELSDEDLVELYKHLHDLYKERGEVWEDLWNAHVLVGLEMVKRDLYFENRIDDKLTKDTEIHFMEYPSPLQKQEEFTLEEFLQLLPERLEVKTPPAHVYVTGRLVNLGKVKKPLQAMRKEHDIDILFRQREFDRRLIHAFVRNLPPEVALGCHFIFDDTGPSIGYAIPLYNLSFTKSEAHPRLSPWQISSVRGLKKEELEWRIFVPLKPKTGLQKNEWFRTEDAWEAWGSKYIDRGIVIEPKWDGRRFEAFIDKDKGTMQMITEDEKRDRAKELKPIIEELYERVNARKVILDGDLCAYTPAKELARDKVKGELVDREDTAAFTTAKEVPKELMDKAVYAIYDIVWVEKPINLLGALERAEMLHKVVPDDLKYSYPTPYKVAYNKKQFFDYVRWARTYPGSEGTVMKVVDSIYPAKYSGENRTNEIAKIKNYKEIDVMVYKRTEKVSSSGKPLGVYMYEACYLIPEERKDEFWGAFEKDGKWYAPIGTTYSIKQKVSIGTILRVVPVRIRLYKREGKKFYSLHPSRLVPIANPPSIELMSLEELWSLAIDKYKDDKGWEFGRLERMYTPTKDGWKRVVGILRHPYKGELVELTSPKGRTICTPEHSVLSMDGEWANAKDSPSVVQLEVPRLTAFKTFHLRLDGYEEREGKLFLKKTGTPFTKDNLSTSNIYLRSAYEGESLIALLKFLGAYVSEGSADKNQASYRVRISNNNKQWLEDIAQALPYIGNVSYSWEQSKETGTWNLVIWAKPLYDLVTTLCGKGAKNKKVPSFIYSLAPEYQLEFMKKVWEGDGVASRPLSLTSISERLLVGWDLLLKLLGFKTSWARQKTGETIVYPVKYHWKQSSNIRTIYYDGYVYDLMVEGEHHFMDAEGGLAVHNTWMFPNVLEVRHDKTEPDTLTTVERLAELGTKPDPSTLSQLELKECPFWNHIQICPLRVKMVPLEQLRFPIRCEFAYEYKCKWCKTDYYYSENIPNELSESEFIELEEEGEEYGNST